MSIYMVYVTAQEYVTQVTETLASQGLQARVIPLAMLSSTTYEPVLDIHWHFNKFSLWFPKARVR